MITATPPVTTFRAGLPVQGSRVHPNMAAKLRQAGLQNFLLDARDLKAANAEERLLARGFEKEDSGALVLGRGHLYGSGQRALLGEEEVQLVTFAERWVQIIRIDAQGRVTHNSVEKLP